MHAKPLISFCLFTYNQAKYIKEAVMGALNQTYSPLEIVISDDCSTDETYNIITDILKNYNGSHKIVVNRNETNLGLAEHINHVASIASGEWLVFAAGDDISLPERTSVLSELMQSDPDICYAGSGVIVIDEHGKEAIDGTISFNEKFMLCGCMAAYHRNCFAVFGNINSSVMIEDHVLPNRAILLGKIALINIPLVKYRCILSDSFIALKRNYRYAMSFHDAYKQRHTDIHKMSHRYPKDIINLLIKENDEYNNMISKDLVKKKMIIDIYEAGIIRKLQLLFSRNAFSTIKKIKLFLLSFRPVRVWYGWCMRKQSAIKKNKTDHKREIIIVDMEQVMKDRVILIDGINDQLSGY